ncbi:MAG: MerR family transcriptional regulator [Flavobacteriia bacterium]|nr:MerR family transcriptional regulator [Flavobacteriia bacterium]
MESKYSIKDLEHLTGVKAHTIRVWEQRYGVVTPERTSTNIRYYVDSDLKRLLNVAVLVHSGMKISKVAALSDAERHTLVLDSSKYQGHYESQINGLKIAMLDFNEVLFDRILTNSIANVGSDETFTKVVGGFIQQVGVLWQTNTISISHEHFASNLIKQKLYVAIDRLMDGASSEKGKTFLLYLPADELHELGLLYLNYILKSRGHKVIYLGQSLPLDYLNEVLSKVHIDALVSIFTTSPYEGDLHHYFEKATELIGSKELEWYCGGRQVQFFERNGLDKRFILCKDVMDMRRELTANQL